MKKYFFILISFILFVYSPATAEASNYGLSIYPPLLKVNIKPGKSITQAFKIENLTSEDKLFVARLVPFTDSDPSGNPLINLKSTAPWLDYFTLSNSNIKLDTPFTIKANSSEQLILNLSIPENATLKDLYLTLLISTYSNNVGINYQGSQVSATTGSNLLVTISSEIYPSTILQIEDLVPHSNWLLRLGNYYLSDNITPISFSAEVLNKGDYLSETKGIFKVTGWKDKPVYLEGLLPVNVISKGKRSLLKSDGSLLGFTPELSNIGPHRVTINIKTDNANSENSVKIIFLPIKICLGLLFGLIFLLVIAKTSKNKPDSIDLRS